MSISLMSGRGEGQRGSALILVAVLMVLAGFILTLGLGPFHTKDMQEKIQITAKRQQLLVSELAAYAQRENKIPCPADPTLDPASARFGFSLNANAADPNDAGKCPAAPEGIVPFRTLGLAAYDVLDGWGHEMTYRISPVMNDPVTGLSGAPANIFMRCRRFPWFDDGVHTYTPPYVISPINVNPNKAMFCCPPDNNASFPGDGSKDLKIYASAGAATTLAESDGISIGRTLPASPASDGPINTMTPNGYDQIPVPPAEPNPDQELFAFAIISHGANGTGAFVPGSNTRLGGNIGADEAINANQNNKPLQVIDHPMILAAGPNYYDDMVVWRTQISLMSELNNATCYLPWR